jgi:hypothetical protein
MTLGLVPEEPEKGNELTQLKNFAIEIERKFQSGRAVDIDPAIANSILQTAKRIRESKEFPFITTRLIEIENRCYAASVNYKDAANRSFFFAELRSIAQTINAAVGGS